MIKEALANLLNSDLITEKTRQVLTQRENKNVILPRFFTEGEFTLLQAVCDYLMAQEDEHLVNIAGKIDQRLYNKSGPGWRYDQLPPDGVAYKTGLKGISEEILLLSHQNFTDLSTEQKNNLLKTVQQGTPKAETWKNFSAKLFFELMLTEAAEHFYSHPLVQAEINYTGFADAKGWDVPQLK